MEDSFLMLMANPLIVLLLSAFITKLVQIAKRKGRDPFLVLGVLSLVAAFAWGIAEQLLLKELLIWGVSFAVGIAGTANLIYNILKALKPELLDNPKK